MNYENEKLGKYIFSWKVSRSLLKMGNTIIDIKQDKYSQEGNLIFVFNLTDKLNGDLAIINANLKLYSNNNK